MGGSIPEQHPAGGVSRIGDNHRRLRRIHRAGQGIREGAPALDQENLYELEIFPRIINMETTGQRYSYS